MKVIALIRVSTSAQEFESQTQKVKEAILRDGYDESDIIFIEDKESGKLKEEERSGLNKLKYTLESEQVSSVYVYELSRISRRSATLFSIREYLTSRGVDLVCLNPSFRMLKSDGSFDENSNIFFGIFSTMAENENSLRIARIMRGKEKKRAEGKLSVGKPLFGYALDSEHRPVPHPKHSLIVKEIFERYAALESSGSIGKDMYQRNALCKNSSKEITIQTYVCAILKDGRYAKIDETSIYPPIISKSLFYKVKNIRENKGDVFIKKSKTVRVYPLQGYLYTEDGYMLSSSYTNNRYLKMNDASIKRVSLNMAAADGLTKLVLSQYLESGASMLDKEKEIQELSSRFEINRLKIVGLDVKISELREENSRINNRIIKGRLSEIDGDRMIDENLASMNRLEDEKQDFVYQNSVLQNKLTYLTNPLFVEESNYELDTLESLKEAVCKYLKKVIVHKLGHSRYKLDYYFLDGATKSGCFYSNAHGIEYYDIK